MSIKFGPLELHFEREIQYAGSNLEEKATVIRYLEGNKVELTAAPGENCQVPAGFELRINDQIAVSGYVSGCSTDSLALLQKVAAVVKGLFVSRDLMSLVKDYLDQDPENSRKILVVQAALSALSGSSRRPRPSAPAHGGPPRMPK